MSSAKAHPQREKKVMAWVATLPDGKEFHARQIAKELNLMGVEVGNILKCQTNVIKCRKEFLSGQIWQKVSA